jgi:hypothetical protein
MSQKIRTIFIELQKVIAPCLSLYLLAKVGEKMKSVMPILSQNLICLFFLYNT